jgi:hypothetical protein
LDWIWRVRGEIPLADVPSPRTAIDRLEPLFHTSGTRWDRSDDMLRFTKTDPAAQDRLAVFNAGTLRIAEAAGAGPVLRYDLTSHALLACFLAPLLFLGFGQLGIAAETHLKAQAQAEKAAAEKKPKTADKKDDAKELPRNPIDVALGAPAPRTKKEREAEKAKKEKEPPSDTPAIVFASIFAALYLIGRWLEPRLMRRLFTRALAGDPAAT